MSHSSVPGSGEPGRDSRVAMCQSSVPIPREPGMDSSHPIPRPGSPLPSPDDAWGTLLRIQDIPWMFIPQMVIQALSSKLDVQDEWKLLADKLQIQPDIIQAIPFRKCEHNEGSCTQIMFANYQKVPHNSIGEVRNALIEIERYDCAKILDREIPALVQRKAGLKGTQQHARQNGLTGHQRHRTSLQDSTVGSSVRSPVNSPSVHPAARGMPRPHADSQHPSFLSNAAITGMPHLVYHGAGVLNPFHALQARNTHFSEDSVSQCSTAANYDVHSFGQLAIEQQDSRNVYSKSRLEEYPADVDVTIYTRENRGLADEDIPVGAMEEVVAKSPSLSSAPSPAHSHEKTPPSHSAIDSKRKMHVGKTVDTPRKLRRESPHLSNSPRTSPLAFLPQRPSHSPIGAPRWDPPQDRIIPSPYMPIDTHNKEEMIASWIANSVTPTLEEHHQPLKKPSTTNQSEQGAMEAPTTAVSTIHMEENKVHYFARPSSGRKPASLPLNVSNGCDNEESGEFPSYIPTSVTESSMENNSAITALVADSGPGPNVNDLTKRMHDIGFGTFPRVAKHNQQHKESDSPFDRCSKLSQSVPPNAKPGKYSRAPRNSVFITYSHDNRAHMKSVLRLAQNLAKNGFGVAMDEKEDGLIPVSEKKEVNKIRYQKADFVVVCISPQYREDYESVEYQTQETMFQGKDKGAYTLHTKYIYRLMIQDLTHHIRNNRRFVVVLMSGGNHTDIPHWLRNSSVYQWPEEYINLNYYLSDPEKNLTKFLQAKRTKANIRNDSNDQKALSC